MRDLKLYVIVGLLAFGMFLYIQYNRPSPVNWSKTYVKTDKIPYGTYILYQQLPALFEGIPIKPFQKRMYNTVEELGGTSDSYILVTSQVDIDEPDYAKMVSYVEAGNDVLIAAYRHGRILTDSLHVRTRGDFSFRDSLASVHFTNPNLHPDRKYTYDRQIGADYFVEFDTASVAVLATNDEGKAIFLRYKLGQGNLYLLSSPDYFTNYALLTPDGEAFASTALSYLNPQRQIIWDDYQTLGNLGQQSPMRVFLNNDYLRPAYLIALFSLLAFVLYGIKRRQRMIPIVDPLENTSIAFAKVVSSVYYHQRDNRDILTKQYTYFMEHVRATYRIKPSDSEVDFIAQLSARSGVDERTLLPIMQGMHDVRSGKHIDDKALVTHHRHIEDFYQQTLWKNNISNNART